MKWYRLMDANHSKKITLHKLSRKGRIWPITIYPSDWKSAKGYKAFVRSSSEQEEEKTKAVQRFQFLLQQFPQNQSLRRIAQRRMLEVADFTSEEMREVVEEEKRNQEMLEEQMRLQQQQQMMLAQGGAKGDGRHAAPESDLRSLAQEVGAMGQDMEVEDKINEFVSVVNA